MPEEKKDSTVQKRSSRPTLFHHEGKTLRRVSDEERSRKGGRGEGSAEGITLRGAHFKAVAAVVGWPG